jgi:hypothetical protein
LFWRAEARVAEARHSSLATIAAPLSLPLGRLDMRVLEKIRLVLSLPHHRPMAA